MEVSDLHNAIVAVAPIFGVAIGIRADKATWRIDFKPEATSQQRAAAQAIIDGFNFNVPSPEETRLNEMHTDAGRLDLLNRLKTATSAQIDTWVDNNITSIAAQRALDKALLKLLADLVRTLT